jgi:hypothetical protein
LSVLVDRFDSHDGFYRGGSRSATTPPQGNPPARNELATSFIQPLGSDVQLASLVLALGSLTGETTARITLLGDTNGVPNDNEILEEFSARIEPQPRPHEFVSQTGPRLEAGATYWVRLSVDTPNANVAWWIAPIEFRPLAETFAERRDAEPWRVATSPGGPGHALRVIGRPA